LRAAVLFPDPILHLDPTSGDSTNNGLARCCLLRTLLSYNGMPTAGGGAIPRPDLASRFPSVSPDGLTWTFELRHGIHYAPPFESVEITSPDFVRAFERMVTSSPDEPEFPLGGLPALGWLVPAVIGARDFLDGKVTSIRGLEAPDRYTFRVRLTRPTGDLAYLLAQPASAPIPPNPFHSEAGLGIAEGHPRDFGRFLVASGPYMIDAEEAVDYSKPPDEQVPLIADGAERVVLVRNPSWSPATDPLRHAYVDRIELSLFDPIEGDPRRRLPEVEQMITGGAIDLIFDWPADPEEIRRYQEDSTLRPRLVSNEVPSVRYLFLNVAQPPFDDVHVRRAVNLALDKQLFVDRLDPVVGSEVLPAEHLFPDATENNLLREFGPYATGGHRGDAGRAAEEMRRSKYDRDGDGRCDDPVCRRVALVWPERGDVLYPLHTIVVDAWSKLGITANLTLLDRFEAAGQCADLKAHPAACTIRWGADFPSGSNFFPDLFSRAGPNYAHLSLTAHELRRAGYEGGVTPPVQQRAEQCLAALGNEAIICWAELDQYLMSEVVPAVPIGISTDFRTFSSRVVAFSWDQAMASPALDQIALLSVS
jgi:peptide/nickel transport system substrate-binding protein